MRLCRYISGSEACSFWWTVVKLDPSAPYRMWVMWTPIGVPVRLAIRVWYAIQRPSRLERARMSGFNFGVKWEKGNGVVTIGGKES